MSPIQWHVGCAALEYCEQCRHQMPAALQTHGYSLSGTDAHRLKMRCQIGRRRIQLAIRKRALGIEHRIAVGRALRLRFELCDQIDGLAYRSAGGRLEQPLSLGHAQQGDLRNRRLRGQYDVLKNIHVVIEQALDSRALEQICAVLHARNATEVRIENQKAQIELRCVTRDHHRAHGDRANGALRHRRILEVEHHADQRRFTCTPLDGQRGDQTLERQILV